MKGEYSMERNRFHLESHVDLSKIESGVGTPISALTPEEYEKAMSNVKSDKLLDNHNLRMCCGEKPVFHQFSVLGAFAIECRKNGHIHNTGLCNSAEEAVKIWNGSEE